MFFKQIIYGLLLCANSLIIPFSLNKNQFLGKNNSEKDDNELTNNNLNNDISPYSNNLDIYFYGPVSEQSCIQLSQAIRSMDIRAKQQKLYYDNVDPSIKLHIQSGGGSLMHAFYICDLIKNIDTPVYTYVEGFYASAATIISVCGNKRFMTKHSSILIHQLSSTASGKFNEIRTEVNNLNFFMNNVKDIYLDNTNFDKKTLEDLLNTDIWLNSTICKDYGLVDIII